MSVTEILTLVIMGLGLISTIIGWVISIKKGDMKQDILQYIEESEAKGGTSEEKLQYVMNKVAEKYKVFKFILDTKSFVEKIIALTKKVNVKK